MPEQNGNKPEDGRDTRRPKPASASPEAKSGTTNTQPAATEGAEGAKRPTTRRRRSSASRQNGGQNGQNGAPNKQEKQEQGQTVSEETKRSNKPKGQNTQPKAQATQPNAQAAAKPAAQAKQSAAEAKPRRTASSRGPSRGPGRRPTKPVIEKVIAGSEIKTTPQTPVKSTPQAASHNENIQDGAAMTGTRRRGRKSGGSNSSKVRIIPLGGLGEVGKNLTVYECGGDSFIVDCGLTFPDESMPGVDLVIPDFTYVLENKDRIKGIAITHGHEDHIGGLAFLLKQAKFPLYGTKLTLGLVEGKLKEHGLLGKVQLNVQKPGDVIKFGCMSVEFINVNHSIPDACSFAIHTPAGVIVQTGDFKIDFTPIRGDVINLARFGELGSHGVLALLSDSTNAERPGSTASERTVGESFDKLFGQAVNKRIIVASFASNVHRLQQIIDAAVKYKRKVAVSGRSMENVVSKALEIGYLDVPSGVLVDVDAISKYPGDKMVIITTGSQGEPMSALTRMAMGDHRKVNVTPNDCIIISATPIPGNEKLVTKVINELMRAGAEVVYEKMYDIHVSGHACQDELKMIMALTRPKFFVPMHGEYKHLKKHASLAISMGIDPKNVFIGDNGRVMETDGETFQFNGTVTAGKVLVDGLGVGDVGSVVLRDRKHLAQDGLIVVVASIDGATGQLLAGPDIVSRGFVYVRESEDMMSRTRVIAKECIQKCLDGNTREWGVIKQRIKDEIGDYLWQKTKRNPMILPVIQEV